MMPLVLQLTGKLFHGTEKCAHFLDVMKCIVGLLAQLGEHIAHIITGLVKPLMLNIQLVTQQQS